MDTWEYLLVRIVAGGLGREYVLEPRQEVDANLQNPSVSQTIAVLDDLGNQGWELVTAEPGGETFWLKRQVESRRKVRVFNP
jgi:hypothetical protein